MHGDDAGIRSAVERKYAASKPTRHPGWYPRGLTASPERLQQPALPVLRILRILELLQEPTWLLERVDKKWLGKCTIALLFFKRKSINRRIALLQGGSGW
jgi:hypothetical protein